MRNLLLSVALIAAPVGVFAAGYTWLTPAPPSQTASSTPSLGDMSKFSTIVSDVQDSTASGNLSAAETRITDLETAWDAAQPKLRPLNTAAWGTVDGAIDDALSALRAKTVNPAKAETALADLQTVLADPSAATVDASGAVATVQGVATTDANGRPLPCEVMLDTFRTTLAGATLSDTTRATVATLQEKGTERCNADDDARADDFFAQGIALMSN